MVQVCSPLFLSSLLLSLCLPTRLFYESTHSHCYEVMYEGYIVCTTSLWLRSADRLAQVQRHVFAVTAFYDDAKRTQLAFVWSSKMKGFVISIHSWLFYTAALLNS